MLLDEATKSSRRDMLKKLAVTSAAAGLASTVVSSIAFADGGTVNSRPTGVGVGSVTLSKVSSTKDEFVVGISAITLAFGLCPFGSPSIPVDQYAWSVENSTVPSLVITGTAFSASLTNATVTASGNINGNYTIRLTVRWVCDQRPSGSTAAWVCRSFTAVVNQDPGGSSGNATIGTTTEDSPGPVCDSPVPTAP